MRIAICDDEPVFVEMLLRTVEKEFSKRNEECKFVTTSKGEEILSLCLREKVDAVFLDIMMPGINGFDIAEKLRENRKNIMIVFVSSKENEVFASYEYNPVWFVPKNQLQLIGRVADRIINCMREMESANSFIQIKLGNKVEEIDIRKIKYFKTEGHYVNYIFIDGQMSQSFRCKLDEVEIQLRDKAFVRVHNRYLVNLRQIHLIYNNDVIFRDEEKVPVSRQQMKVVKDKYQDYMRSIR